MLICVKVLALLTFLPLSTNIDDSNGLLMAEDRMRAGGILIGSSKMSSSFSF